MKSKILTIAMGLALIACTKENTTQGEKNELLHYSNSKMELIDDQAQQQFFALALHEYALEHNIFEQLQDYATWEVEPGLISLYDIQKISGDFGLIAQLSTYLEIDPTYLVESIGIYVPFFDEGSFESNTTYCFYNKSASEQNGHEIESNGVSAIKQIGDFEDHNEKGFVFVIEMATTEDGRALPWRRCYCTRSRIDDTSGQPVVHQGQCSGHHGDTNSCWGVCDRAGIDGQCPGTVCGGC